MPTVTQAQKDAKASAQAAWQEKMDTFTKVTKEIEDAKRKGEDPKIEGEYYTDTQIDNMLEKAFEVEFSNATGFAGAREEYDSEVIWK